MPIRAGRLITSLAAATVIGGAACGQTAEQERVISADRWDTLNVVTPRSVNDTTLIDVALIVEWAGGYAISNRTLRLVSPDGRLRWTFDERGPGPGEIQSIIAMHEAPKGHLWIYDYRNVKLLEIDAAGSVRREMLLRHLPATPVDFGFVRDRLVLTTQSPDPFIMVLDTASLELVEAIAWPWEARLSPSHNFEAALAWGRAGLVVALTYGRGFLVYDGRRIALHDYITPIPWARKASPQLTAARADSARFGAVSVRAVDDEIHMLFGGRPRRAAHPFEPTNLIDVYGFDGSYRRSYRLPSHFDRMAQDGQGDSFILARETDAGMPMILNLEPVPD